LRDELPRARDADKAVAAIGFDVFFRELLKRGFELRFFNLFEAAHDFVAFGMFGGGGEDVFELFRAQRFLRRKKQRF